jgi:hypothetical protein
LKLVRDSLKTLKALPSVQSADSSATFPMNWLAAAFVSEVIREKLR